MIKCDKCGSENMYVIAKDGAVNDFRCRDCGNIITSVIIPHGVSEADAEKTALVNKTIAETKGLTVKKKVKLSGMTLSQAEHYSPYSYMPYQEVLKIAEGLVGKDCGLNATKIVLCNLIKNN